MNLKFYFRNGQTMEQYMDTLDTYRQLHIFHFNRLNFDKEIHNEIKKQKEEKILVITEIWCYDSIALLPVIQKYADIHGKTEIRICIRDENPDLIDNFLTDGKRAIPVFLFLDADYNPVLKWGPRPAKARKIFEKYVTDIDSGKIDKKDVLKKIRTFYSKDRGKTSIKEVLNLLKDNNAKF